ncbi:MAG TPA: hypothetical protein PKI14_04380 [Fervidobacterium sp.]|nr:hypothetical protein [Fervidobacterium sp.]
MYKCKIAVGISGKILVLEGFPDDEYHAGLQEMLEEMESEVELDELPGVYECECVIKNDGYVYPHHDYAYLDVYKVKKISF